MNMNDKYIYKTTMTFGESPNYKVRTTYITDEGVFDDDQIILEDANSNGRIITEESTIQNGIIPFVQPLHYKGHPHESNNGFMYTNHRIDQRDSV